MSQEKSDLVCEFCGREHRYFIYPKDATCLIPCQKDKELCDELEQGDKACEKEKQEVIKLLRNLLTKYWDNQKLKEAIYDTISSV